jgi:hypothetical protein
VIAALASSGRTGSASSQAGRFPRLPDSWGLARHQVGRHHLSATSSRVPSADTFSKGQLPAEGRHPGKHAAVPAPHSRRNSAFNGARLRRCRACTAAETVGIFHRLPATWALS